MSRDGEASSVDGEAMSPDDGTPFAETARLPERLRQFSGMTGYIRPAIQQPPRTRVPW